jgi:hypothetical protein
MGHPIDPLLSRCTGRTHVPTHKGGCACGAVRYELQLDPDAHPLTVQASEPLVRARAFKLLSGDECLSGHQFASSAVHRFYCERCGVCSFSRHNVEQLGGEFYAVDLRWLDRPLSGPGI